MPPTPLKSEFPHWFARPLFRWSAFIIGGVVLGVLIFEEMGISIFSRIGMPHEFCYLRDPKLVWMHVISDTLIGLAYVSISATLAYLVYKGSKGIPFHWVFLAFGLFIVSCGFTHFMEIWVMWEPVYWLSGYVKIITAAASVATAVALFPLVPKIFNLVNDARLSEKRRTEIEQLNQELERFNYSVAHDLRSPLRGISGFSEILREDCASELSPKALGHLELIQTSAAQMDQLITDLLRYAVITRQKLQLTAVPLAEVLSATTSLMSAEIGNRNAEVVTVGPLPVVLGDATLLQVVFRNLMGNGIKFVAPGVRPRVEISAETRANTVSIYVTDNGVGIPKEARERIFGLFERFHPEHPGTGIGLSIVHRAVERLNGKIRIGPSPHCTGTRITLLLAAVADGGRTT